MAGFVLSVTKGLFSPEAAERIVQALDIPGARITHTNAEATSWHPTRPARVSLSREWPRWTHGW
ncbi:hypothetical protein GCM10009549_26490 [Streptomyces thermoalcalitolerans]|uniref:Uncharacterized protein n=1 Tax=Streptomyces thermoalcalitolerans TaxID=65605 RepID=A0ABN1NPC3_9ACTN